MNFNENTKSDITNLYEQIATQIPSEEMQEIVYEAFEEFWKINYKKTVVEKCVEFGLLRQCILTYLEMSNDIESCEKLGNSLMDYIDMTFSYLFYKDSNGKCALEKKVDNEFYFCLLTFTIDRIEFPSLVMKEFRDSYYSKNRNKISLQRRNYLATLMVVSRDFINQLIVCLANQNVSLSYKNIRKHYKLNLTKLISSVGTIHSKSRKYIESQKVGNVYRLYRGYEIDAKQNVIVNRKERLQDANKSVSFTTKRLIAESFANYRHSVKSSPESTSFDDRLTLAKTMFHKFPDSFERVKDKKSIVSEYEIAEEDIVLFPISTTITEYEVFAFPEKARLVRYTITNSY